MTANSFLFLDVDDVLNSDTFFESNHEHLEGLGPDENPREFINPAAVERLNRLLDRADPTPTVVLSSSWRHEFNVDEMTSILQDRGFEFSVEDRTPGRAQRRAYGWGRGRRPSEDRGVYLRNFLKYKRTLRESEIDSVVVLDNLPVEELEPLHDYVVQTEPEHGLQDEHVE